MKKFMMLFLALVLLIGVLPVSAQATEITWWAFPTFATVDDTGGKYEQGLIDAFQESNPDITVKLEMIDFQSGPEKIVTAIEGGTAPDVLFDAPGRIIEYGKNGKLADLNDLFTDEFKADVDNEQIIGSCSDGENYYMYPISTAPFLMAVNKTILEKEGLMEMVNVEGDRTWTTDEFSALNAALAEKGYMNSIVFCQNQGGDQGTRAFIANLFSAQMVNPELTEWTINSEAGIKALQYVVDEVAEGRLTDGITYNGGGAIEQFVAGTVSGSLLWSPGLAKNNAAALEAAGVEALALPLPSDDGTPELEYLVNGFAVFNNGDDAKIAAAKKFITFLADDPTYGPQNVLATNAFPVRTSFGDLYPGNEDMAFYASMAKYYGAYYNTIDGFAGMRPAWWANLQAALTGEKTAEEAMNDFVADANAAYAAAQ